MFDSEPPPLDVFSQLANLLGKIGDSFARFTKGLTQGVTHVSDTVRRERESLTEYRTINNLTALRRDLSRYSANKHKLVIRIDIFLEQPSKEAWEDLKVFIEAMVAPVLANLEDMLSEDTEFYALAASYPSLVDVLARRWGSVIRLRNLSMPQTAAEMDGLRRVKAQIDDFLHRLSVESQALADYAEGLRANRSERIGMKQTDLRSPTGVKKAAAGAAKSRKTLPKETKPSRNEKS